MTRKKLKFIMWAILIVASTLTFLWYDWKLFIIIALFMWSNNISIRLE